MMMRFRSLEKPFMPDASLAPFVQMLQEALRLVEVLASVRVLRVDFQHRLPLGNGLGQLLLTIVADARIVVLVDEARPRLAQEWRYLRWSSCCLPRLYSTCFLRVRASALRGEEVRSCSRSLSAWL